MLTTVLHEVPEDPEIRTAWNALAVQMERPEVFFTYEWSLAVGRAFHEGFSPLIFLMYDAGQLRGVAALATDPHAPGTAFFLASSTADYCDILSAPADRAAVLSALSEETKRLGIRNLILANLPADSATHRELASLSCSSGFHFASRPAYDCGIVTFGNEQERQELLKKMAGKEREKRALKKLATFGRVELVHLAQLHEAEQSLPAITEAQIAHFLATDRVSPLVQPERREFLKELNPLLASAGWLRISELQIGGRPIAWNYGFQLNDNWFWYLPTYLLEHEQLSPGSCLLRLLVLEGCANPSIQLLDLGLGDESYKGRVANGVRQTRYVQLSASLPQHCFNVARNAANRFAEANPRAKKQFDQARHQFHQLAIRRKETGLAATAKHIAGRFAAAISSKTEILFFEPDQADQFNSSALQLIPLTWDLLSEAAIANADDAQSLQYLMRCAKRLKKSGAAGYGLRNADGRLVHFLWTQPYDGFHSAELGTALTSPGAPDPNAVLIFDCWTPASVRGQSHYATALRLLSGTLSKQGKQIWIFSVSSNTSSLRGIVSAGFQYRFSMVRSSRFGRSSVARVDKTTYLFEDCLQKGKPCASASSYSDVAPRGSSPQTIEPRTEDRPA